MDRTNLSANAFKFVDRGGNFTDSIPRVIQNGAQLRRLERIPVVDEVARSLQDSRFAIPNVPTDLLYPGVVRAFGDSAQFNASRGQIDEKQNHKALKTSLRPGLHGEESRGHNRIEVTGDEFFPGGLACSLRSGFDTMPFEDVPSYLSAMSLRCYANKLSGVVILATSASAYRRSCLARTASRRR